MVLSLVFGFALAGWRAADPPLQHYHLPGLREFDFDALRRTELERTRRGRAMLEKDIVLIDRIMKEHPDLYKPEQASRIQQRMEIMREHVKIMKDRERELWEQQPGGISAPMPREKK